MEGMRDSGGASPSASSEWKGRVGTKVALGAFAGAVGGACLATVGRSAGTQRLAHTAFNMGANFAIFAGLAGTMQELIRASSGNTTWMNSLVSGSVTGGFLCGLNRGPRSVLPGAAAFGALLAGAHVADDHLHFAERYRGTLVWLDLLEAPPAGAGAASATKAPGEGEGWSLWPSFLPAPIRIHSEEEVERLAKLRRQKLEEKMNPPQEQQHKQE